MLGSCVGRGFQGLTQQLCGQGWLVQAQRLAAVRLAHLLSTLAQQGSKVVDAAEAAALVRDGDMVTMTGFDHVVCPDLLLSALRERYDLTARPRGLTLFFPGSSSDGKGAGTDRLAAEGLVSRLVYGWVGNCPALQALVRANKVQAWNLPLGVVSHMFRDMGAGRPGPVTRVGLGTFVDPRDRGGRMNEVTKDDIVHLIALGGQQLLWYKVPPRIDVALLRGTTADTLGNVSLEREPLLLENLYQAMAARNTGGKVVVQVERVVPPGSLPPRSVHIPGVLVDQVVVAPPAYHPQTMGLPGHDPSLTGEIQAPLNATEELPLGEDAARRVIAHRAMLEVELGTRVVNLGVGVPEGVAAMIATHGHHNKHTQGVQLTVESGVFGGQPQSGFKFGTSRNPSSFVPMSTMLDFYDGGGDDIAFLGMAECDAEGNVNVSRFGGKAPGCGGFIDISQSAKKVVFTGTFTAGGLQAAVRDGALHITREGRCQKFVQRVEEVTFAAASAGGRSIRYVTERAVFGLLPGPKGGLQLLEVAPGVDVERDVLAHMAFRPAIVGEVGVMDPRIFDNASAAAAASS